MRRFIPLSMMLVLALAGCQQEEAPPPEPEAPPPPTCDEIYQEFRASLAPLYAAVEQARGIDDPVREAMVANFAQLRNRHLASENGQCAMDRVATGMTALIREAKDHDRWRAIKGACQVYDILRPNDTRHAEDHRRADLILARPIVRSRGYFESDGYLYAFLEVTDRDTNRTKTYQVREGEEFHGILRLEEIVGNQQAVEIWYEPLNDTWRVLSPRERGQSLGGRRLRQQQ